MYVLGNAGRWRKLQLLNHFPSSKFPSAYCLLLGYHLFALQIFILLYFISILLVARDTEIDEALSPPVLTIGGHENISKCGDVNAANSTSVVWWGEKTGMPFMLCMFRVSTTQRCQARGQGAGWRQKPSPVAGFYPHKLCLLIQCCGPPSPGLHPSRGSNS